MHRPGVPRIIGLDGGLPGARITVVSAAPGEEVHRADGRRANL